MYSYTPLGISFGGPNASLDPAAAMARARAQLQLYAQVQQIQNSQQSSAIRARELQLQEANMISAQQERAAMEQLAVQQYRAAQMKQYLDYVTQARNSYYKQLHDQQLEVQARAVKAVELLKSGKISPQALKQSTSFLAFLIPMLKDISNNRPSLKSDSDISTYVNNYITALSASATAGPMNVLLKENSRNIPEIEKQVSSFIKATGEDPSKMQQAIGKYSQIYSQNQSMLMGFNPGVSPTDVYDHIMSTAPQYSQEAERKYVYNILKTYGAPVVPESTQSQGESNTGSQSPQQTQTVVNPVGGYIESNGRVIAVPSAGLPDDYGRLITEYNESPEAMAIKNLDSEDKGSLEKVKSAYQKWYARTNGGGLTSTDGSWQETSPESERELEQHIQEILSRGQTGTPATGSPASSPSAATPGAKTPSATAPKTPATATPVTGVTAQRKPTGPEKKAPGTLLLAPVQPTKPPAPASSGWSWRKLMNILGGTPEAPMNAPVIQNVTFGKPSQPIQPGITGNIIAPSLPMSPLP